MPITYDAISTVTLGSNTSSINITSLPTSYTDLRLVIWAGNAGGANDMLLRFNSDSANNYAYMQMGSTFSTTGGGWNNNMSYIYTGGLTDWTSGTPGNTTGIIVDIFNYRSGNRKVVLGTAVENMNPYSNLWQRVRIGQWFSGSAITSLTLSSPININAGSKISIYGIARA